MNFNFPSDSDFDSSDSDDSSVEVENMIEWIARFQATVAREQREDLRRTRSPRKSYDHGRALYCIKCDYLATFPRIPLFNGRVLNFFQETTEFLSDKS